VKAGAMGYWLEVNPLGEKIHGSRTQSGADSKATRCWICCRRKELNAVRSLLEVMVEPLGASLALAAVEEEEITPETPRHWTAPAASLARGEGIPHEEILREFGLTK